VALAIQQFAGLVWALALLSSDTPLGTFADLTGMPLHLIAASALAGLMYYAIAYGLFLSALRFMTAGAAGSYFILIPVFGVGFATTLLGERLHAVQWAGAALILASAAVLVRLTKNA